MRHIQYLDRTDRRSRRLHISYYAANNECTLWKVKWPAHWCTWPHTLASARMQMHPYKERTQSAERSGRTVCEEKKIFEEDMLPVAMERSWWETYTQRRTPTHHALSVLTKLEQSHAPEHKDTHRYALDAQSLLALLQKVRQQWQRRRRQTLFRSIWASVVAHRLEAAAFTCTYGMNFPRTKHSFSFRKLCQSVNQILPQRHQQTGSGRMKYTTVLLNGS